MENSEPELGPALTEAPHPMRHFFALFVIGIVALNPRLSSVLAQTSAPPAPLLQQGKARVVLVGDSITGQSRNVPVGYAHQLDWALEQTYPGCHPTVIALGGSGQSVRSWLSVEKRSLTEAVFLDVKGIDVKAVLEEPTDVLIIMLGMNDVLAPYVKDEPASWEEWTATYRELITDLRSRLKPKVAALATATLCTEDPASPKNQVMDALNAHAASLASEMGLRLLPTNETMKEVLRKGRRLDPRFHVTGDFVHPNEAGHLAVAIGMLRGLGEAEAARALETQRLAKVLSKAGGDQPQFSYAITPLPAPMDGERQRFRVTTWVTQSGISKPALVTLAADGWKVTPTGRDKDENEFEITGIPDRLDNLLPVTAQLTESVITTAVRIPAPWLVTTGAMRKAWNERQLLDLAAIRGPVEEAIAQQRDFTSLLDVGHGQRLVWRRYFPSVNFTGGDASGSVDFAAVTHAQTFEAGYGARWIHADREHAVTVELGTKAFAGTTQLAVYLNGEKIYDGLLTGEPGKHKSVEARLRPGWNALVFNLNHVAWQMQCSVDVKPVGDDSLEDLRYSVSPHEPAR